MKTSSLKHLQSISIKGGKAVLKKYGTDYFRKLINKRWKKYGKDSAR